MADAVPVPERLLQHSAERRIGGAVEIAETVVRDRRRRGIHVRAEPAIPDRQHRAVVAVGLRLRGRMMDGMHRRRDDDEPEPAIERGGQAQVGVRIQRRRGRRDAGTRPTATAGGPSTAISASSRQRAEQDVERMMTLAGRDVDVRVAVMDEVQPPQQRHAVDRRDAPSSARSRAARTSTAPARRAEVPSPKSGRAAGASANA